MIGNIIGFIVIGLIAGALARLLVPGRDPMSIPATIALGVIGSLLGGFVWRLLQGGDGDDFKPAALIGSVLGAVVCLLIYRAVKSRGLAAGGRSRV